MPDVKVAEIQLANSDTAETKAPLKKRNSWPKGVSGNPKGRPPKGQTMTDAIREYMDGIEPATGKTRRETLADTLYELAFKKKDVAALKYLYDRLDGTPKQSIDHGGLPPAININFDAPYDEL